MTLLLILVMPLVGVILVGRPVAPYLDFPPRTQAITHAPFSLTWSIVYASIDLLLVGGILAALTESRRRIPSRRSRPPGAPWPWWGWAGLLLTVGGWVVAWNRFPWLAALQRHSFIIPWTGYLLTVNALTLARSGSCLLTRAPVRLILLALCSCCFWWIFEYLNRFVQNWYYLGVADFGPSTYALLASLAFCTVLPAVMSTYELLLRFPLFNDGLSRLSYSIAALPERIAWWALVLSGVGLAGIGVWPDLLFPMVWVAPLVLIASIDRLWGEDAFLAPLQKGDYRHLVGPAVAALICGVFWEMWNVGSLAKWRYSLPFVQWGHLFEMPLLGYGGYLPFGVICWMASKPLLGELPATVSAGRPQADSHLPLTPN